MSLNWFRRLPRIALVSVVRNEERFLPAFLAYHRLLGVERFYIFLHCSTDRTPQIAAGFPGVRAAWFPNDRTFQFQTDRQRAAGDLGVEWARQENYPWLIFADPDEFMFPATAEAVGAGATTSSLLRHADLRKVAADSPSASVQLLFETKEVLPALRWESSPFHHQVLFQADNEPTFVLYDHDRTKVCDWRGFLGHRQGKRMVRTAADVQTYDCHRWTVAQFPHLPRRPAFVELPTTKAGWHAHYFVTGSTHWLNKYAQVKDEPATWPCGSPVEAPTQLWKTVRNTHACSLEEYVRDCVMLDDETLTRLGHSGSAVRDERIYRMIEGALGKLQPADGDPMAIPVAGIEGVISAPRLDEGPEHWELSPTKLPPHRAEGFHAHEWLNGRPFRWSAPEAILRLEAGAGSYEMIGTLDRGISLAAAQHLEICAGPVSIPLSWSTRGDHRFVARFEVGHRWDQLRLRSPQHLGDPAETRALALPWVTLTLRRVR
jgi:hypothetical protein